MWSETQRNKNVRYMPGSLFTVEGNSNFKLLHYIFSKKTWLERTNSCRQIFYSNKMKAKHNQCQKKSYDFFFCVTALRVNSPTAKQQVQRPKQNCSLLSVSHKILKLNIELLHRVSQKNSVHKGSFALIQNKTHQT